MTMTAPTTAAHGRPAPRRKATTQHFLTCPPDWYRVEHELNVWMHPDQQVDRARAAAQWRNLRDTLTGLGHRLDQVDALPHLPDQVFTRDPAIVCDNGSVLMANFRHRPRVGETEPVWRWLSQHGYATVRVAAAHVEGGDVLDAGRRGLLLGHGFRSDRHAADDLRRVSGRHVTPLQLVDPRFYHLDTALAMLDDDLVAYYPWAFSAASRAVIDRLWPHAVHATTDDALAFGLNAISDGHHVVMPAQATHLAGALMSRGLRVIGIDISELAAAGGGPHCCVLPLPTRPTEGEPR